MKRNIVEVINQIKAQIPAEAGMDSLIRRLDSIVDSLAYTAPEMIQYRWSDLASTLYGELGSFYEPGPAPEWVEEISAIVRGERCDSTVLPTAG